MSSFLAPHFFFWHGEDNHALSPCSWSPSLSLNYLVSIVVTVGFGSCTLCLSLSENLCFFDKERRNFWAFTNLATVLKLEHNRFESTYGGKKGN